MTEDGLAPAQPLRTRVPVAPQGPVSPAEVRSCLDEGYDCERPRNAPEVIADVVEHVSGSAWVSFVELAGRPAVRACIIGYRTTPDDVDALIDALCAARAAVTS